MHFFQLTIVNLLHLDDLVTLQGYVLLDDLLDGGLGFLVIAYFRRLAGFKNGVALWICLLN